MAKKLRLKSSPEAESQKISRAEKYAERGVATGGRHISTKKLRRTLEARFVPVLQRIPKARKKTKTGRRHTPPPTAPSLARARAGRAR